MAQSRRRRRRKEKRRVNYTGYIAALAAAAVVVCGVYLGACRVLEGAGGSIYDKSDEKIIQYIDRQTKKDVYLPNISVDGVDIGGMTREEADKKLRASVKLPQDNVALIIKQDNDQYTKSCTLEDFGIHYDLDGAAKEAFSYGRTGTEAERAAAFRALKDAPKNFQVLYYDPDKIKAVTDGIASGINVSPVNAAVKKTDSGFQVTPATIGYTMDGEQLYQNALAAVENRDFGTEIAFSVTRNDPQYTEADFQYIENEIGSCYSRYKGGDENRITNLRNGCEKIDGVVLYPDEVFSTNNRFNPCTYENGWRNAGTIVNGKVEDSIGGGMCQVSSALYQAVLEAELEVVERFNHSMKVGYADYAFDATLAGDYKDLKFKNNTGYPMYIESYLTSSNVVVRLYGYEAHDAGRKLEFKNKLIKTTPPEEPKITEDDTKPEGYEEYTVTALDGKTYELYKYVYENGTLTDTVKVNTSTYLPRRAEVIKGTKPPEETTQETEAPEGDTDTEPGEQSPEEPQQVIMDSVVEGEENLQ